MCCVHALKLARIDVPHRKITPILAEGDSAAPTPPSTATPAGFKNQVGFTPGPMVRRRRPEQQSSHIFNTACGPICNPYRKRSPVLSAEPPPSKESTAKRSSSAKSTAGRGDSCDGLWVWGEKPKRMVAESTVAVESECKRTRDGSSGDEIASEAKNVVVDIEGEEGERDRSRTFGSACRYIELGLIFRVHAGSVPGTLLVNTVVTGPCRQESRVIVPVCMTLSYDDVYSLKTRRVTPFSKMGFRVVSADAFPRIHTRGHLVLVTRTFHAFVKITASTSTSSRFDRNVGLSITQRTSATERSALNLRLLVDTFGCSDLLTETHGNNHVAAWEC